VRLEDDLVSLKTKMHQEKRKIQGAGQNEIHSLRTKLDALSARYTVLEASAVTPRARLDIAEEAVSTHSQPVDDQHQRDIALQAREAKCREQEGANKQEESKLIVKLVVLVEEVKSQQSALDAGSASFQMGINMTAIRLEAIGQDERDIAARKAVLATKEKEMKEREEARVHVDSRTRASTRHEKRKAVEIAPTQSAERAPKSKRSKHPDAGVNEYPSTAATRVTNVRDTVAAIHGDKITNVEGGQKLEEA